MNKEIQLDKGQSDCLIDILNEDEAERQILLAKPTCFIVVGKPGVGKSTLAKKIAESWKCILIDDTDLLNKYIQNETQEGLELKAILSEGKSIPENKVLQLILARLNSPDVEHYGYVLSCLPFVSEECLKIDEQIALIKNLKLIPDFIVNIKCPDIDLVRRLSDVKQDPYTGNTCNVEQWKSGRVDIKKETIEEEVEDKEEQSAKLELPKETTDQMVCPPENMTSNACSRISMYKTKILRKLEDYMTAHNPLYLLELDGNCTPEELHSAVMLRLGSMALKPVAIPILLQQTDDADMPKDADTDDLHRVMCNSKAVAPCFRWRRSRWRQNCPVALKEGQVIPGIPEFTVGFQDKLYVLSSQDAYKKFVTNPRKYLLPPMPRAPCRVSIIGPPQSGKSTLCKLLAQEYNGVVLDLEEIEHSALAKVEQERLDKIKEEATQAAIEKIKTTMEHDSGQSSDETSSVEVTGDHPDVKAMVENALEEAKQMKRSPFDLQAEVLQHQIKEIEQANKDAEVRTGWVLDNFPRTQSQMDSLQQGEILPDIIFCLRDSGGNQVLKRMYEMNKESVDAAVRKRQQDEQSEKETLSQKEHDSETRSDLELGYPDAPEMNEYKLQLEQFASEWEQIQSDITVAHWVLDIDGKSPEDLLQEMVHQMEKPFGYVAWELSEVDVNEEREDAEALAELEKAEESSCDTLEEEDEEDKTAKRLLGDTLHFCPVVLKNHNVLRPCTDEFAARYRERTFYFSSPEAIDVFLQNPKEFVSSTEPLKPPALRVFLLGTRGSGKTSHGVWLAQQLGLFHIQFREHLQTLIMAKTKHRVAHADEEESTDGFSMDLDALIKKARGEDCEEEVEDTTAKRHDMEQEVVLTDEENAIKAYLSNGAPLSPQILDIVVAPFWKQEPFKSTGFILEGFPHHPDEVQYILQRQLFPDVAVNMSVDVTEVQKRLLPTYLEKWRERQSEHEAKLNLLQDLRKKKREKKRKDIAKKRAELMAAKGATPKKKIRTREVEEEYEEEEVGENIDQEIEAMLEEEFRLEEDSENMRVMESKDAAVERLEMKIEERFVTDENDLVKIMELLSEQNISSVSINASRKPRIVRKHLLLTLQPMLTNRESLFQQCLPISHTLAQKLLASSYKFHSAFGCIDPVKQYRERDLIQPLLWPLNATFPLIFNYYIYFFGSNENRITFMLNPLKYLRQPKPLLSLPIKIAVLGPPKSGKTTVAEMFTQKYGLAALYIGSVMRTVLETQGHTDLAAQMKNHLCQGHVVPDDLAIQCLEVALMSTVCSIRGYVLEDFPMTLRQAELMSSRGITPMLVTEIELDTDEVVKRGHAPKAKPKKHVQHDSAEIFNVRNSHYNKEVQQMKGHYREQYQNWIVLDGSKSKMWIWNTILKELSISLTHIHNYLERTRRGQAACINRMCITPKELQRQLGEFGLYCPVCLALHYHLVDGSETAALTHAAEYMGKYYKMCGNDHFEKFLSTPDQFVFPGCPHPLPGPDMLPKKLDKTQVKKFPAEVEMRGFCPVSYMDGDQGNGALVQGKMEYAVEYKDRIYIFETKEKQDIFMRQPELYWNQKLPIKIPPLCEPIILNSLPTLGYLEQGVAVALIKAMSAVGCLRPKHPFLTVQQSALIYVAQYLKAFNPKFSEEMCETYKQKLAVFEENCALIPYLRSNMSRSFRPPNERLIGFEFKLKRFLALKDSGQKENTVCLSPKQPPVSPDSHDLISCCPSDSDTPPPSGEKV